MIEVLYQDISRLYLIHLLILLITSNDEFNEVYVCY